LLLEDEVPLISIVYLILINTVFGKKEDEHWQIHLNTAATSVEAKYWERRRKNNDELTYTIDISSKSRAQYWETRRKSTEELTYTINNSRESRWREHVGEGG